MLQVTACILTPWKENELIDVPIPVVDTALTNTPTPTSSSTSSSSTTSVTNESTKVGSSDASEIYFSKMSAYIDMIFDLKFQQM